jgi:PhnB protein
MATESEYGRQRVIPMLSYADPGAAIEFLCRAFGFAEHFRLDMPDGTVGHAELRLGDDTIMLSPEWPDAGVASPRRLEALHAQICVVVDDVDAHYRRARDAGATIVGEPVDQFYGARTYRALDPEGHRWIFQMPLPVGA